MFLHYVTFKANTEHEYNVLETQLNLPPLEARRKHMDFQMLYTIIVNVLVCSDLLSMHR